MTKEIVKNCDDRMKKAVEVLRHELAKIHAGRATTTLLDSVRVESYGQQMPLNQLGTVAAPEARLLTVSAWDKTQLPAIEKAILAANLGFTPMNDGIIIRIPVQPPTEERRKELVKLTKKFAEESKVAIRNVRRDAIEHLKKAEKEEHLSEDERKHAEAEVQKLTDRHVKEIDDVTAAKDKEIMEV